MVIMSVDLGKARTGLAICDKSEMLASPLGMIEDRNLDRVAEKIADYVKDRKVEMLVIGLPKNMDGTEGESAQNARSFAKQLEELCNIPTVMQDERGTTITAHSFLNTTDTRGKKRKKVVDTVAATIILEDYLNFRKNNR
ncbi:MAG: Holliday junction resolvase RuvX [Acutalibacteraceae bacterium]|nr:Holliday junction resolvase RuvX [Acutalibacteraceae bacterium]